MRSRSSSKHSCRSMEVERPKTNEEPQLSGAYIRSLVKQLSSSRTKEPMNPKSPNTVLGDEISQDPTKLVESPSETQQPQPPVPQPKKQVRRRLHTSRPYQEKLLNMAEARREIVTALKFHRAAMKQAVEQQQQQHTAPPLAPPPPPPPPPPPQPLPPPLEEPTPRMCHTNVMLPNYLHNPPVQPYTYPSPLSWPYSPIAPLPVVSDNLNLPLPNQPLGLNLSFQGFTNLESPFYNNKPALLSLLSPSSSSSSYSSPSSPMTLSGLQVPAVLNGPQTCSEDAFDPASSVLHPVMDDEEMAEIRSLGEQHEMEWNDTMNLMTSAWWCKFLNKMELDSHTGLGGDGDGFQVFEEIMDIPTWLSDGSGGNASDSCFLPQHFDDYYSDNYLQDTALPRMDIGEIEGLDVEWVYYSKRTIISFSDSIQAYRVVSHLK
ncbi:hypothetical protein J5N97_005830 [Dioscorea zingiberensis]|uniref:Hydroxyproline-rich glycoprotein family protein n=1 Tax=Dioscorea zingiberensis TaxID=325984 RepID=A0A9D5DAH3_9LILI|nr:hypothetical protein J5N97_005830 [Dioscorea zingiberensis]